MTNNIRSLHLTEPVHLYTSAIQTLKTSLGPTNSRDVVERAAYEVSDRLHQIEQALMQADLDQVFKVCSALKKIAAPIGLSQLCAVVGDLQYAIARQDFVAIAAISKRLFRLSETTLYEAIDFADNGTSR